jgi:hypothetical protein
VARAVSFSPHLHARRRASTGRLIHFDLSLPLAYRLALHVPGAAARAGTSSPGADAPLEIGGLDDPQEREAEAAADRVMRTPRDGRLAAGARGR